MKALFIIDTAIGSGKGHLIRTLEIVKQFKKNGWEIVIIIERCILGEFASKLMVLADTLGCSESNNNITIIDVINKASSLNCNKIIIDSYKIKYQNISKVNSPNIDVYRIIDAPTDKFDGVQDIKLGIRFNLQSTSDGMKVIYPIRQLPVKKNISGEMRNILFYFGSEPSNQHIKLADKIAEDLNPSIKSYFYISKEDSIDSQNMLFVNDIDKILPDVSLIICSASNIIYEAAFMAIPCITISTNKSQENRDVELELLGHCINLQQEDLSQHEKFKNLIESAIINLRVLEVEAVKGKKNLFESSDLYIYNCITEKFIASDVREQKEVNSLESGKSFRPVTLADANAVLSWRNSPEVRELMVNSEVIPKLSHYNWWFNNKRMSFIYEINTIPSVYLWHEQLSADGLSFFIGGWTPLVENLPPLALFTIIDWQIQLTKSINSHARWLAVINKKNVFTQFANVKLGFKEIKSNHPLYKVATKVFKVDDRLFNFYQYEFN
jgi:spore coat polysaccharide biosynthesis predicted glycosyltransferase SpsG